MSLREIHEVAAGLGLGGDDLFGFGPQIAKLTLGALRRLSALPPRAQLVLVSAMSPTKAGEGKTTVSIGLAQGLAQLGTRVALALREPSLGPIFGMKGGGTGGGRCRLEPSDRINLHFTGDLHAVTSAHNLLAALLDNALHFGSSPLDPRRVLWRRVLDMNDRALRKTVVGLGGTLGGLPRETGFDITASSEVMAILCLARDQADLKLRLGRIVAGHDAHGRPVTAGDLRASGPMAALLHDAQLPNLVQTGEGVPAFVHGGPFGNIAHGCSSVMATRAAVALADVVVTEAGFGFDLGGEKFFDIKCRSAGLWPSAVVLVVTARALRCHGGERPGGPRGLAALEAGLGNLDQHVASARSFGFAPVVALNVFDGDPAAELQAIEVACAARGLACARITAFAEGGAGGVALARLVGEATARTAEPRFLYALEDTIEDKIGKIARTIYGAKGVSFSHEAIRELAKVRELGLSGLPVCIAKTHLSLSDDAEAVGRPRGFDLSVRSLRIAAGAGYVLALTGDIVTMPALPAAPAAFAIDLGDDGSPTGIH